MPNMDRQSGFTLLEVLIASAFLGLVMVGAFTLMATNQNAYRHGMSRAETHQHGRVALQTMGREMRMAGYDLSGVLSTLTQPSSIQTASQNSLTFVADMTGDGVLDQVTYRHQGSQVIRDVSSWDGSSFPAPTSGEVASGVSLLTFSYFDDAIPVNNPIPTPVAASDLDNIRRVRISLVTTETTVGVQEDFPLVLDVRLRN